MDSMGQLHAFISIVASLPPVGSGDLAQSLVPSDDVAAVTIVDRANHYEVRGTTAHELTAQMATLGPRQPSGKHAWGFTAWEVRTSYVLAPTPTRCAVADARVNIEIVTTLPRWIETRPVSWKLRRAWGRMLENMAHHESMHRGHGISAARNVAAALEAISPQPDCKEIERQARSILRREVAEARKFGEAFDLETDFGAKQGVHLGK
jgi:predicted secreted Zn-dependent protease